MLPRGVRTKTLFVLSPDNQDLSPLTPAPTPKHPSQLVHQPSCTLPSKLPNSHLPDGLHWGIGLSFLATLRRFKDLRDATSSRLAFIVKSVFFLRTVLHACRLLLQSLSLPNFTVFLFI